MSNNVRLYDYVNIDEKMAQKLFSKYESKFQIGNLHLITEGMSTSNYIVEDKNSTKKYLLKIY